IIWTPKGTNGFLGLPLAARSLNSFIIQGLILMSVWCEFASHPTIENLDAHMLQTRFITSHDTATTSWASIFLPLTLGRLMRVVWRSLRQTRGAPMKVST